MGSVEERTFDETLDITRGLSRDLLLGNGFSIAAHDGFAYQSLLRNAAVSDDLLEIFASNRTSNFEAVMRVLLAESVGMGPEQGRAARMKIEQLKHRLIKRIHEVHPPRRSHIASDKWENCEAFLEHFIGKRKSGRIFTTNYDLLLSWAIAPDRDRIKPDKRLRAYEGFRGGTYDGLGAATIIYLHGALHLYSDRGQSRQMQWRPSGVALHDQVAELLHREAFPMIVTEGASTLKIPKSPGFLKDAHAAFKGTCKGAGKKALFTLGHGLGAEDSHLLNWIPNGTVETVCLGAFGRSEIAAFYEIANGWVHARSKNGGTLKVYIFDSTAVAWGP